MISPHIQCRIDTEMSEIQNFLGWAIHELIYDTRTAAKQEKVEDQINDKNALTEKDYCYQMAKSMHILHQDAMQDKEYLVQYFPVFVASYNKGG